MSSRPTVTTIPATLPMHQTAERRALHAKRRVASYSRVSTDSEEQFAYLLRSTEFANQPCNK